MDYAGKSEVIIQDISGCGKFQVIVSLCVFFLANSSPAFTMMFMAFGSFNPGWKCLQPQRAAINIHTLTALSRAMNVTDAIIVLESNNNWTPEDPVSDRCEGFESCDRIQFNPDSSTIVSEWGLVCSRKWVPSLVISLQMAGVLVGGLFAGYLGDAIGRKVTIYGALAITTGFNFLCILSSSWEIFCALRFLAGLSSACVTSLNFTYSAEFLPRQWRVVLQGIPAWNLSAILFALTCMYYKNWRHVHMVTVVLGFLGLIPALWMPESLRWLEVKNKTDKFNRAAKKIVLTNGKPLASLNDIKLLVKGAYKSTESAKKYSFCDLFRKEVRTSTLLLTLPWFVLNLVNYAIGFGVKAMHGDFYLNLIIVNSVDIPFVILPIIAPNLLGRIKSALSFAGVASLCLLGASCMNLFDSDDTNGNGVVVLIFTGKVSLSCLWCVMDLITLETYPTVIRSIGTCWCVVAAKFGAILAPFFIPNDAGSVFVSYLIMGIMLLAMCGLISRLPETKGKPLAAKLQFDSNEGQEEEEENDGDM